MRIVRSRLFTESLERLRASDSDLFTATAADLRYLINRRRAAELPQVRFGLAQSRHHAVMGEVRTHIHGSVAFVRTICALPPDEAVCAFLLLGDKNSQTAGAVTGNDWYDEAIPLADSLWDALRATNPPSSTTW
ncbi:MAG: hypothetical protein OXG57_15345 [Acidimicrobiaceae bacterium]|nr:hypothetical protein [Acidimicrobiaceae bacterium]MYF27403.1 hypothetical protein [Gammaproteobacteria bacterium]